MISPDNEAHLKFGDHKPVTCTGMSSPSRLLSNKNYVPSPIFTAISSDQWFTDWTYTNSPSAYWKIPNPKKTVSMKGIKYNITGDWNSYQTYDKYGNPIIMTCQQVNASNYKHTADLCQWTVDPAIPGFGSGSKKKRTRVRRYLSSDSNWFPIEGSSNKYSDMSTARCCMPGSKGNQVIVSESTPNTNSKNVLTQISIKLKKLTGLPANECSFRFCPRNIKCWNYMKNRCSQTFYHKVGGKWKSLDINMCKDWCTNNPGQCDNAVIDHCNKPMTKFVNKLATQFLSATNARKVTGFCSCLNSQSLSPYCSDGLCQEVGYRVKTAPGVNTKCPDICAQVINCDPKNASCTIAKNKFNQQCKFSPTPTPTPSPSPSPSPTPSPTPSPNNNKKWIDNILMLLMIILIIIVSVKIFKSFKNKSKLEQPQDIKKK